MSPFSDSRCSPQPNTLMQHLVTPYFLQRAMEEAKIGGIFPSPPRRVGEELSIYADKSLSVSDSKYEAPTITSTPAGQKHGRLDKKQAFSNRQTPPSQRQTSPSAFEQRSPGRVIHHYSVPSSVPQVEPSKYTTAASVIQQRHNQLGADTAAQFIHHPVVSTISPTISTTDIQNNTLTQTMPSVSRHSHVSPSHTSSQRNVSTHSHILESALRKHTPLVQYTTPSNHVVFSSHYTVSSPAHTTSSSSATSSKTVPKEIVAEPTQTRYSPPPRPGVPHIDPVSVPHGIGPIRQPVVNLARLPDADIKRETFSQLGKPHGVEKDFECLHEISTQVKTLSPNMNPDQHIQSIPPTVNPFTFPKVSKYSSSGNIVSPFKPFFDNELANLQTTTLPSHVKISVDRKVSDSSDDMPRLVPEVSFIPEETTFNRESTKGEWQTMVNNWRLFSQIIIGDKS